MKPVSQKILFLSLAVAVCAHAKWPDGAEPVARAVLRPQQNAQASGTVEIAKYRGGLLLRAYLTHAGTEAHSLRLSPEGSCEAVTDRDTKEIGNISVVEKDGAPAELSIPSGEAPKGESWIGKTLVLFEKASDLASKSKVKRKGLGRRLACGTVESAAPISE
jgi:Cu/Zn superoxide dismutase